MQVLRQFIIENGGHPAWCGQATPSSLPHAPDVHFIIGASGQLGTEFALALQQAGERVVLADIKHPTLDALSDLPFVCLDVRDRDVVAGASNGKG